MNLFGRVLVKESEWERLQLENAMLKSLNRTTTEALEETTATAFEEYEKLLLAVFEWRGQALEALDEIEVFLTEFLLNLKEQKGVTIEGWDPLCVK